MSITSNEYKPGLDDLITLGEASMQSGLSPSQLRRLVNEDSISAKAGCSPRQFPENPVHLH